MRETMLQILLQHDPWHSTRASLDDGMARPGGRFRHGGTGSECHTGKSLEEKMHTRVARAFE